MTEATVKLAAANYSAILKPLLPWGVDLATLIAVVAIEAGGDGIDHSTGKPVIRFEVHQFWEAWGRKHVAQFTPFFSFNKVEKWKDHAVSAPEHVTTNWAPPGLTGQWISLHTNTAQPTDRQAHEWYALTLASSLAADSVEFAYQSTSFGAAQLMGFNHEACGYRSAVDMAKDMPLVEKQMEAFVNFIEYDHRLLDAAKIKSWASFARFYNGSGQVPVYSKWLSDAYEIAKKLNLN